MGARCGRVHDVRVPGTRVFLAHPPLPPPEVCAGSGVPGRERESPAAAPRPARLPGHLPREASGG